MGGPAGHKLLPQKAAIPESHIPMGHLSEEKGITTEERRISIGMNEWIEG